MYRLAAPPAGVDPDVVDKLWDPSSRSAVTGAKPTTTEVNDRTNGSVRPIRVTDSFGLSVIAMASWR